VSRFVLVCVALAACRGLGSSVPAEAPTESAAEPTVDRPDPSRRARVPVLGPDGQPYAGKAQWCFVTDMPGCTTYKNCNEAVLTDGELWIDLADNCPLDVVEGRLSVIPNLCFGTFISDRDGEDGGGEAGDRFAVEAGETRAAITLRALAEACEDGR